MVYQDSGAFSNQSTAELTEEAKAPFCLTAPQKAMVKLSSTPLSCTQFVMRLNAAIDGKFMRLLKSAALEEALISAG